MDQIPVFYNNISQQHVKVDPEIAWLMGAFNYSGRINRFARNVTLMFKDRECADKAVQQFARLGGECLPIKKDLVTYNVRCKMGTEFVAHLCAECTGLGLPSWLMMTDDIHDIHDIRDIQLGFIAGVIDDAYYLDMYSSNEWVNDFHTLCGVCGIKTKLCGNNVYVLSTQNPLEQMCSSVHLPVVPIVKDNTV